MYTQRRTPVGSRVLGLFAAVLFTCSAAAQAQPAAPATSRAVAAIAQQPLRFEPLDGKPGFVSRGIDSAMMLTAQSADLAVSKRIVRMAWPGANPNVQPAGSDLAPGVTNYLIGSDPSAWRRGIRSFSRVRYPDLYRGIDLLFYGNQRQLEYDFVVAPGADPRSIRIRFSGENALTIDAQGDLVIRAGDAQLVQRAPVVYQECDGIRERVSGRYVKKNRHEIGFAVADYDRARTLYIDPVLTYASFFGGNAGNYAKAVAVDSAGSAYVTGYTGSTNFPTTLGAYRTTCATCSSSNEDVFVTKITSTGVLVYSTYVGGTDTDDNANAIAVDASGNAYVTGQTYYSGSGVTFPVVNGFTITPGGGGFLFKLDATGSNLLYSTQLRGGSTVIGYGVAVEGSNAYVAGMVVPNNDSFPLWPTSGTYSGWVGGQTPGNYQAFILKINTSLIGLGSLIYATRFGGWDLNYAYAVAVDGQGQAYVTGDTTSNDFPTTAGVAQATCGTDANCNTRVRDAFITKFNATGNGLVYSTFAGGSNSDSGYAIAIDAPGNAYVGGVTSSQDFPVTGGAFDTSCGSNGLCDSTTDGWVLKLSPTASTFLYSTYLGGKSADAVRAIAVDAAGNAHVGGDTSSIDFPVTADAIQPARAGTNTDAFVTVLNPTASALAYSSYLGGTGTVSGGDKAFGVAVDSAANTWVVGQTDSTDFPSKPGAISTTHGSGLFDGFVVKVGDALTLTSLLPASGSTGGGTPVRLNGKGFMAGATVTFGGFAVPGGSVVSPTTITVQTPAHVAGTVDVVVTSLDGQTSTLAGSYTYVAPLTFTDDPLQPGITLVKAVHINELRNAVATLRSRYMLTAYPWTDTVASGVPVRGLDVTELRSALADVYNAAGVAVPTWHPASIVSGSTVITAAQIAELRAAAQAMW